MFRSKKKKTKFTVRIRAMRLVKFDIIQSGEKEIAVNKIWNIYGMDYNLYQDVSGHIELVGSYSDKEIADLCQWSDNDGN